MVKDGRFGAYVTDGETNATPAQGRRPSRRSTLERAAELLAEKRAKGPAPKKRAARKRAAGLRQDDGTEDAEAARRPQSAT